MTTEMVERVATLMRNYRCGLTRTRPPEDVVNATDRSYARAAIRAMMEPTDEVRTTYMKKAWDKWTAYDLWQAMLRAVLGEDEGHG